MGHQQGQLKLQKQMEGNSLAVQWLGLSTRTAKAQIQCMVGELRSHKLQSGTKKKEVDGKSQTSQNKERDQKKKP